MGEIGIYQTESGAVEVRLEQDTVWLRQEQMGQLFGRERSVITKHLRNVFAERELESEAVCAKFAHTASDGKTYQVEHYNLDVIISVGYRVKSQQGTRFRQWATGVLRQHLVHGYSLNQRRLEAQQEKLAELRQAIALSSRLIHNKALSVDESQAILAILEKYSLALSVLDDYDHQRLQVVGTRMTAHHRITYNEAMAQITLWRENASDWTIKESVKTKLKVIVKRTLRQYGYPPDMQLLATRTV